jgi:hypothetical protein
LSEKITSSPHGGGGLRWGGRVQEVHPHPNLPPSLGGRRREKKGCFRINKETNLTTIKLKTTFINSKDTDIFGSIGVIIPRVLSKRPVSKEELIKWHS